MQTFQK